MQLPLGQQVSNPGPEGGLYIGHPGQLWPPPRLQHIPPSAPQSLVGAPNYPIPYPGSFPYPHLPHLYQPQAMHVADPESTHPPDYGPITTRKRGRAPKDKSKPPKRSRARATEAGVGPSTRSIHSVQNELNIAEEAAQSIPTLYTQLYSDKPKKSKSSSELTGGCDCWALVIGTNYSSEPNQEAKDAACLSAKAHLNVAPSALRRPSSNEFSRLLCIICLVFHDKWHTWSNTNGGATDAPRAHIKKNFPHKYIASCQRIGYQLRDKADLKSCSLEVISDEITQDTTARYIAELVAEQDLAFNIVTSSTFRRLLCYVGQGNITAEDIPERRIVEQAAADLSREEKDRIKLDLKNCEGRVSITSDLWSDHMDRSFMAVTGHYKKKMEGKDTLVVELLAFRVVEGMHSGVNLGAILFGILSEYEILGKLGTITLDNASNNDTMMEQLEFLMHEAGYSFDHEGNRVRCFPHIVNLAVIAFRDALEESGDKYYDHQISKNHQPSQNTLDYLTALKARPDNRCREIVKALRHGQRKRAFQKLIKEGNDAGLWKIDQKDTQRIEHEDGTFSEEVRLIKVAIQLRIRNLLLDCKTRWSSTRDMIQCFLELYPAICHFIMENKESLGSYAFSHREFEVLTHIMKVFDVAHRAQELLSSEQTPTLALAFPVYLKMLRDWKDLAKQYGALSYAIKAAMGKIELYMEKSRTSPIHIIAMFMNPGIKYTLIDRIGSEDDKEDARKVVKYFVRLLNSFQSQDQEAELAAGSSLATKASSALGRGAMNLFLNDEALSGSSGSPIYMPGGVTPPCSPTRDSTIFPSITPARPTSSALIPMISPARAAANRRENAIALEHDAYLAAPLWPLEQLGKVDMVNHWSMQKTLPILQAISRDVLPVQASSVSSERVFSSSKNTCTLARNKLGADTVEMLQILKYSLRQRYRLAKVNSDPPGVHSSEDNQLRAPDALDAKTLDLMACLGDDWGDAAILDADNDILL
ncbi:hAT family dimerization protein [Rhizoctonia solani AG-3 Rhs1AP]|uniref:HAT family dimerization protein n=2 Tax=Rhizoctonia solani AG-3 TaxID=1086053 RepID=A0A074RL62_9AGAM|nr:hAT family dimerization protein [Rhizoctonia solani AG-3 Rhs1AP]KEP45473.1 hAT family dimerization protein [Rhizoctonia solani 123E]